MGVGTITDEIEPDANTVNAYINFIKNRGGREDAIIDIRWFKPTNTMIQIGKPRK
jgi:hypothetical protein